MHTFHRRSKFEDDEFWLVKIEKLREITDTNLLKFIVEHLEHAAEVAIATERGTYKPYHNPHFTMLLPDGSLRKGMNYSELLEAYPWFNSLALAYAATWDAVEGAPDIHGGNFMQRDDGTIVITDPVWQGGPTPYQAYDAWYKSETDYYGNEDPADYEENIRGPRYLQKKPEPEKRQRQMSYPSGDDDIPF
jgi:hypothetical protein